MRDRTAPKEQAAHRRALHGLHVQPDNRRHRPARRGRAFEITPECLAAFFWRRRLLTLTRRTT